jgi:hypothetical protein
MAVLQNTSTPLFMAVLQNTSTPLFMAVLQNTSTPPFMAVLQNTSTPLLLTDFDATSEEEAGTPDRLSILGVHMVPVPSVGIEPYKQTDRQTDRQTGSRAFPEPLASVIKHRQPCN